jgi:hypothetical protein
MSIVKQTRDHIAKVLLGKSSVPRGLAELHQYFRMNDPIEFQFEKQEDGSLVAVSQNFRYGSIVTHARSQQELDENVKDAIMTAFEIPSSYAKEAAVHRVREKEYAFA